MGRRRSKGCEEESSGNEEMTPGRVRSVLVGIDQPEPDQGRLTADLCDR